MKSPVLISAVGAALAAVALFASPAVAVDVDPIVIKGSHFFYKTNGTEFGNNAYTDPLADVNGCKRDIPYLVQLQTNTIRVYAVDPTLDHSECMSMLASAGIYVIADLSQPKMSINRNTPRWEVDLFARYTSVVDSLQNYTNVLGFFAGNEVSNQPNNTAASAFVKAAVRDTKTYIKQRNYRAIGVGYAANDDPDIRIELADYFNCGPTSDSIDFWGYNIYSWCGNSTYTESLYDKRTAEFADYSVPAFFAEYGCNHERPRPFTEVGALFGDNMTSVWSGGIVYMYFQESNNYGLVSSISESSASPLPDFSSLSKQIAMATPKTTNSASYNPTNTKARACPTSGSSWRVASALPPSPNGDLCNCMQQTLTCVAKPGLDTNSVQKAFDSVCGYSNGLYCAGVQPFPDNGTYGAYSMCNSTEQLSFAFDQYYKAQNKQNQASACDFGGAAQTRAAASASGNCQNLISQAGTAGAGTVTSVPTGMPGSSSKGSPSSSSTKASASMVHVPSFDFGLLKLGAYVVGAALTGVGMILL
ncbi:MAG: 1,3-beta-glucanosyltransferase gas1 [Candelina mexicana]|nr:MAG: 1,3-beta-glucanosyltransferase gas1 [Candelina mexicana]